MKKPAKRIRVLQLQPKCDVRTADLQEEIVRALPKEKFEVTNAYFHGTSKESGIETISELSHYFNFTKREQKGLRLRLMWKVWRFCRKQNFDIVITHRFKTLSIMLKLNRFLKIPLCLSVIHGFGDFHRPYRKKLLRKYNSSCWRYIGVSPAVSDYLLQVDSNLQVTSIDNAIDTEKIISSLFPKEDARQALKLSKKGFVFGTIGRMVNVKNQMTLLQSFHKLYLEDSSIKLIIIGEGKMRAPIEDYIKTNKLQSAVHLTGEIIDANRFIKAFDVFVLPSSMEGFGMVLLEAMAGKIPTIATNVGGVPYALGQEGLIVPPNDKLALYSAMRKYYKKSDHERALLGGALYKRLLKHFDTKLYRKRYLSLIKSALH